MILQVLKPARISDANEELHREDGNMSCLGGLYFRSFRDDREIPFIILALNQYPCKYHGDLERRPSAGVSAGIDGR